MLQASIIKFDKKFILNRHFHKKVLRKTIGTQEIWIVMKGKLKVTFYGTDKNKICSKTLNKGIFQFYLEGDINLKLWKKIQLFMKLKMALILQEKI